MLKVTLTRAFADSKVTMGMLKIDNVEHEPIFTLENPWRNNGPDSSIPAGIYQCEPHSGSHFKDVWILRDVPHRTFILIHPGNTEKDTLGCILLGLGAGVRAISQSGDAIKFFRSLVGTSGKFQLTVTGHPMELS